MATRFYGREARYDSNGNPLSGGKLYFYDTGTSTPKNTYSDNGLTTPNANPVVADSAGRFGPIFLTSGNYKAELRTSADVVIWTEDPVEGTPGSSTLGATTFTGAITMSSAAINETARLSIASAGTVNIGAAAANSILITGTTTITAFDNVAAGRRRSVTFAAALTLTHNGTSLILPGGANITTAANDTAEFLSLGSGNWLCLQYKRQLGGVGRTDSGATVTIVTGDHDKIVRITNGGAVTVNLPALSAVPAGFRFTLQNNAGGTAMVTRNGSDTFEGAGTTVGVQNVDGYRRLTIESDGTNWITSTRKFRSAAQTITTSSRLTIAHGLGCIPLPHKVGITIKNTTTEFGYSVGDEVQIPAGQLSTAATDSHGLNVQTDATNIYVDISVNGIRITREDTFAGASITTGNWQLYAHAEF